VTDLRFFDSFYEGLPNWANDLRDVRAVATAITSNIVARNGFYGAASLAGSTLIVVVGTAVMVRNLGTETFGIWALALTAISLATFLQGGINIAVARLLAHSRALENREAMKPAFIVGLVLSSAVAIGLAGVIGGFALPIARLFHATAINHLRIETVLVTAAIAVIPVSLRSTALAVPVGLQRYGLVAVLNLLQDLATWGTASALAVFNGSITTIVQLVVASTVVSCVAALVVALLLLPSSTYSVAQFRTGFERVGTYAVVTTALGLSALLFNSIDRVTVGAVANLTVLAEYVVIIGIASKINQLIATLWQALLPLSSALMSRSRYSTLLMYLVRSTAIATVSNLTLAGVLWIFAGPILRVWLGPSLSSATTQAFQIAVVVYAAFSVNVPAYHIANGAGFAWMNAVLGLVGGALTISLIATLVPSMGLNGAALANAGYLLTLLVFVYMVRKLKDLSSAVAAIPRAGGESGAIPP
jgi:O-antigen/teichoic acid export membrane protein